MEKSRQELQLDLADARVEYADGLRRIVMIKRELAFRAFRATSPEVAEPLDNAEYSYGEHEINIVRGEN